MQADLRDRIAVTLMGWVSRLATKQYRNALANYIQLGMSATDLISDAGVPPTRIRVERFGPTL